MTIKELRSYLRSKCERSHEQAKRTKLSGSDDYFEGKLTAFEEVLKKVTSMIKEEKESN